MSTQQRIFLVALILAGICASQEMLVRVYVKSWDDLKKISSKHNLDIAGARANQWYDIVADRKTMDNIISSGLPYEVKIYSLELEKEKVRQGYHSYEQVNQILRNMANNYPTICKLDSLPIPTYQGRWLYGVKISDQPVYEDPNEPGFLIDALHHSREWATIEVVLFFADSMLKSYGVVPEITQIIDNTEIYCFPIINADGYAYDYPYQNSWRKNREPFGGAVGTDPNRNYGGCSGDLPGDWGAVDEGEASHTPSDETFCGAYMNSGDETRALTMFARSHIINAYMSFHSYSEYLMWGWGWTTSDIPDATVCARFGTRMAGMVNCLGGGTYLPGQVPEILYPVSGSSLDWFYSWCHWVGGIANLSYTTEVGTSFYQPVGDLSSIEHENFKALKYLAQLCRDSIPLLCEGVVAPPVIYDIGTVPPNFTIYWHPVNPQENHPVQWEIVELSNPNIKIDSLESGTSRWLLQGYTLSTTQAHSGTHSLWSGNSAGINNAVRTIYPYLVQPGDSFIFWCYYNLENNYDVSVVEVSENTKEWFNLDTMRFTGTQTSWVRKTYSLAGWVGKSVYFRFRTMYDSGTQSGGFYVDDIYPVSFFGNVDTIASNIPDTFYTFASHSVGDFYYYVRGYNTTWGWGDYSGLKKVTVLAIGMPSIPTIIKPLDFACLPVLQPTLSFYSVDPDNDDIQYRILWDTDPNFASPDSATTGLYSSGTVVDFVIPSQLVDGATYWWKVKCTDPAGSGYWTSYTTKRSFTIGTSLPQGTCSWFQTTSAQFNFDTFNGTQIQGDSVVLVPSGQTVVDTLLFANFESGMPSGWTVVNSNGDPYQWTTGTTSDLGGYTPPNYGSAYAYYSDDDAGSSAPVSTEEGLVTPKVYVGGITGGLELVYGYGYNDYSSYDYYRVRMRRFVGGSWQSWVQLREYNVDGSGTETISLDSYLPCDSMQFEWYYTETSATWAWACAVDNVLLRWSYQLSNDYGTLTGVPVSYHDLSVTYPRDKWGDVVWRKASGGDSVGIQVEYWDGSGWQLVPNSVLPGNSAGFFTHLAVDTVKLTNVDTVTYNTLRLKALFYRITKSPNNPALLDWEVGNLSSYIGIAEAENSKSEIRNAKLEVYPNPFRNVTGIKFQIPNQKVVSIKIYDISGRVVKSFSLTTDYCVLATIVWDGTDDLGRRLPSGIYFVRLATDGFKRIEKAILLR